MPPAPRRSGAFAAASALIASLAGAHVVDIWLLGHASGHPLANAERVELLVPFTAIVGAAALAMRVIASARGAGAGSSRLVPLAVAAHAGLLAAEVVEQLVTERAELPVILAVALSALAHLVVGAVAVMGAHAARRVGARVAQRRRSRRRASAAIHAWSVSQVSVRTRRCGVGRLALRAPPLTA